MVTSLEGLSSESVEKANLYDEYFEKGLNGKTSRQAAIILLEAAISEKQIIERPRLKKLVGLWIKKHDVNLNKDEVNEVFEIVWSDELILANLKKISFEKGRAKENICLDINQVMEASYWLMGRFYIKRIELSGKLMIFNDKRYEIETSTAFIRREGRDILKASKNNTMNEIIGYIEDKAELIKSADLEKYAHLQSLNNGIYNIKTNEFTLGFNPEYLILNEIPHNYDESATFEGIRKILKEIMPDEKDLQTFFDFLSTCLHPYTGIDFQLINLGKPGTGKSQLGRLAELVLGEDNVKGAKIHAIASDSTTQNDIAYAMLNYDDDLSQDDIKRTDILKSWITQGRMSARSIYAHLATYRPKSRLMSSANSLYEIANDDDAEAIYQRTHIIEINKKFRSTDKEIHNIFENTIKENPQDLDGFITYLLKNAHEIYKRKKITYPMKSSDVMAIWNQAGNKVREFIKKYIVVESGVSVDKFKVWVKFQDYAEENNFDPKGKNKFYEKFEEIKGVEPTHKRDSNNDFIYVYQGIRLKTDEELKRDEMKASAGVMAKTMQEDKQ